jgi:hypothetical protein
MPLGIVGIIFASMARSAEQRGDWSQAAENVRKARLFTLIGLGVGAVIAVVYLILFLTGAFAESSSTTY